MIAAAPSARGLQERARRRCHRDARKRDRGRAELCHHLGRLAIAARFARPGDARDAVGAREPRQRRAILRRRFRIGAQQQVGAGVEQVQHRRAPRRQRPQSPSTARSGAEQGGERRMQHRAAREIDDRRRRRARAVQAARRRRYRRIARSARRRAPGGVRTSGADRARPRTRARQRRDQQAALPAGIGVVAPVLQRAAAAVAEMRAGGAAQSVLGVGTPAASPAQPWPRRPSGLGAHQLAGQREAGDRGARRRTGRRCRPRPRRCARPKPRPPAAAELSRRRR